MKALTISQPYASKIAAGEKWVENRTWSTRYRGPLAIHAGTGTQYVTRAEMRREGIPVSCVLAVCKLIACLRMTDAGLVAQPSSTDQLRLDTAGILLEQIDEHKHTNGPWCWVLAEPQTFEPVSQKGARGLWDWTPPTHIMQLFATA